MASKDNFENNDLATKYYKTLQHHLDNDDIDLALRAVRALTGEANAKVIKRPMVQLLAAKALLETHMKVAELEIKAGVKPDSFTTNIYNTLPQENDDIISISQRLNRGLSHSTKR